MTSYAVDEDNNALVRIWATGRGQLAAVVSALPSNSPAESRLDLARTLTALALALWRCYTHPAGAADSHEVNSEGWRREQTREAFVEVIPGIRTPNLPDDDGSLLVNYDPVEESAHRVGRALHDLNDADLIDAVCAEVAAELQAVESAERGDLGGRAAQAVALSRADANPLQVTPADSVLTENPLAGDRLFLDLEPTAASVAAAHWLKAAADVVAGVSKMPATQVLLASDDIEALPYETPNLVLELFDFSTTAYRIVVDMVSNAMLIGEGVTSNPGALLVANEDDNDEDDEPAPARLTPLDPQRPALDLLEDLLIAIRGCRLLYAEYMDTETEETAIDATFCDTVRKEAKSQSRRLM